MSQQDQKSQLQNKLKGMQVLRSRILDARIAEIEAARSRMRKTQVGTGDRSGEDPHLQLPAEPRHRSPHRLHDRTSSRARWMATSMQLMNALAIATQDERLDE